MGFPTKNDHFGVFRGYLTISKPVLNGWKWSKQPALHVKIWNHHPGISVDRGNATKHDPTRFFKNMN